MADYYFKYLNLSSVINFGKWRMQPYNHQNLKSGKLLVTLKTSVFCKDSIWPQHYNSRPALQNHQDSLLAQGKTPTSLSFKDGEVEGKGKQ